MTHFIRVFFLMNPSARWKPECVSVSPLFDRLSSGNVNDTCRNEGVRDAQSPRDGAAINAILKAQFFYRNLFAFSIHTLVLYV